LGNRYSKNPLTFNQLLTTKWQYIFQICCPKNCRKFK
jgi:hypothetical protein